MAAPWGYSLYPFSRPKFLFSSHFHFSLTFRTGFHIPYSDVIAATVQAQPTNLASIRWGYVSNDATNYNILDCLAVRAAHGRNLLTEETTPFVHLGFIATGLAAIFQFPSHLFRRYIPVQISHADLLLNKLDRSHVLHLKLN